MEIVRALLHLAERSYQDHVLTSDPLLDRDDARTIHDDATGATCTMGCLSIPAGGIAAPCRVAVVVFRGSDTCRDWWHNLKSRTVRFHPDLHPTLRVHRGFLRQWNAVRPHVYAWLRFHASIDQVYLVGHSLGGALSILGGTAIARDLQQQVRHCRVLAIGCPRVGNRSFARHVSSVPSLRVARVSHRKDVVTRVPWPPWYRHAGPSLHLSYTAQGRCCGPLRYHSVHAYAQSVRTSATCLRRLHRMIHPEKMVREDTAHGVPRVPPLERRSRRRRAVPSASATLDALSVLGVLSPLRVLDMARSRNTADAARTRHRVHTRSKL